MKRIGIFYSTTSGNTEDVARKLRDKLGLDNDHVYNVGETAASDLEAYDLIIFGIPTWGVGELHEDWEGFLPELEQVNFQTRKVALYGLGDQEGNPDSFCDAMGVVYKELVKNGANIIGYWPDEGYNYDQSEAITNGKFVGLPIDEDNEPGKTPERIAQWVELLNKEMQ